MLAIGIVVDDAIVVVENVERHIELGETPIEATRKAMDEVSGPIIAIALVLCAVFVPTAFVSGLTGQFYRQFALTIAISTVISAFNSLTLSPALASRLLLPHGAPNDRVQRVADRAFGWFFRLFNRFFTRASGVVHRRASRGSCASPSAALVRVRRPDRPDRRSDSRGCRRDSCRCRTRTISSPSRNCPTPPTLDRTEAVIRKMSAIALEQPGVASAIAFPGLSINGFVNASNAGIVFVTLKPAEERRGHDAASIVQALNARFAGIQEAFVAIFPPPPVQGLGTVGGFKLYVEDRAGVGFEELYDAGAGRDRARGVRRRRSPACSPASR